MPQAYGELKRGTPARVQPLQILLFEEHMYTCTHAQTHEKTHMYRIKLTGRYARLQQPEATVDKCDHNEEHKGHLQRPDQALPVYSAALCPALGIDCSTPNNAMEMLPEPLFNGRCNNVQYDTYVWNPGNVTQIPRSGRQVNGWWNIVQSPPTFLSKSISSWTTGCSS